MANGDRKLNLDPLLITANFVTYMGRKDHTTEDGKLHELYFHLEKAIRTAVYEFGQSCDGYNASVLAFSSAKESANADRCTVCDEWISVQNRPEIIPGLVVGAEHDGASYCFDHLPPDSGWLLSRPLL